MQYMQGVLAANGKEIMTAEPHQITVTTTTTGHSLDKAGHASRN
jgi:hypothetical protein